MRNHCKLMILQFINKKKKSNLKSSSILRARSRIVKSNQGDLTRDWLKRQTKKKIILVIERVLLDPFVR